MLKIRKNEYWLDLLCFQMGLLFADLRNASSSLDKINGLLFVWLNAAKWIMCLFDFGSDFEILFLVKIKK